MPRGKDTREILLEEGHALASEVGLKGVTIGRLADAAGISKAGIYAHFDSKEELLRAVLERAVGRFVQEAVGPGLAEPPGEPRLRAFFGAWLDWTDSDAVPGGCLFISSAAELDDRPGALRELLLDVQRRWTRMLRETAREAREEGHFRDDLDPAQVAFELHAIIHAYHHYRRLFRDETARARARYAFEALVERARRG